jgi:hypothetical protein
MKKNEVTAAELWDEATGEIFGRTQKPQQKESPAKADVIFCYPKPDKSAVNE